MSDSCRVRIQFSYQTVKEQNPKLEKCRKSRWSPFVEIISHAVCGESVHSITSESNTDCVIIFFGMIPFEVKMSWFKWMLLKPFHRSIKKVQKTFPLQKTLIHLFIVKKGQIHSLVTSNLSIFELPLLLSLWAENVTCTMWDWTREVWVRTRHFWPLGYLPVNLISKLWRKNISVYL